MHYHLLSLSNAPSDQDTNTPAPSVSGQSQVYPCAPPSAVPAALRGAASPAAAPGRLFSMALLFKRGTRGSPQKEFKNPLFYPGNSHLLAPEFSGWTPDPLPTILPTVSPSADFYPKEKKPGSRICSENVWSSCPSCCSATANRKLSFALATSNCSVLRRSSASAVTDGQWVPDCLSRMARNEKKKNFHKTNDCVQE